MLSYSPNTGTIVHANYNNSSLKKKRSKSGTEEQKTLLKQAILPGLCPKDQSNALGIRQSGAPQWWTFHLELSKALRQHTHRRAFELEKLPEPLGERKSYAIIFRMVSHMQSCLLCHPLTQAPCTSHLQSSERAPGAMPYLSCHRLVAVC